MVAYVEISPKVVNPRDIAGNAEEEEEINQYIYCSLGSLCIPVNRVLKKLRFPAFFVGVCF